MIPLFWYAWRVFLEPQRVFYPSFFVCFGVNFLYVFSYFTAPDEMNDWFMDHDSYLLLLILCCLSVYAFIIGDNFGQKSVRMNPFSFNYTRDISFTYCLSILLIAYAAQVFFITSSGGVMNYFSSPHGTAGAWRETTAYIHSLPSFMWPMVLVLFARRCYNRNRHPLEKFLLWLTVFNLAFEAFVFGNRADTIRLVLIFGLSLIYIADWRPTRLKLLIPVAVAFLTIILFPLLRDALYLGSERQLSSAVIEATEDIASSVADDKTQFRFRRHETGSNLYQSAAIIKVTNERLNIDWGFGWLAIPVGFIPRHFWPEKHRIIGEWFLSTHAAAENATRKWKVIWGSYTGGMADAFMRFGWGAPLFWAFLGFWGGRLQKQVQITPNLYSIGYYISFLLGLTHWITHNANSAFAAWFFFAVPLFFAGLLHSRKNKEALQID